MQQQYGAAVVDDFDKLGWGTVELARGERVLSVLLALEKSPLVEAAEPVLIMRTHVGMSPATTSNVQAGASDPDDSYYEGTGPASYEHQWALENTGQSPPGGTPDADINASGAWDLTTGRSDVFIAVLDSGIPMQQDGDGDWDEYDLSHPDLDDRSKIILGPDYIGDGEGVRDGLGHGTHVGGIAAAETNNGTGIAGVCQQCALMPIQVFDAYGNGTGPAFYNGVIHAVDYAEDYNLELVINFSGGVGCSSNQLEDAVEYAHDHDVTIVASAGNESGGAVQYPAAYSSDYPNVVAVSSSDHNDDFSSFSSKGSEVVIAAPGGFGSYRDGNTVRWNGAYNQGTNIFSTTPNYSFTLQFDPIFKGDPYNSDITQDYGYLPGTSQAAPHVAGTVGLMLSADPDLSPSVIRARIENTAEDANGGGFDHQLGHGRVNTAEAVQMSVEITGPVNVIEGEQNTWTASVFGSSYTSVAWYRQDAPGELFYGVCSGSLSCTTSFPERGEGALRIVVGNSDAGQGARDEHAVQVNYIGGCHPPHPTSLAANATSPAPNAICPPNTSARGGTGGALSQTLSASENALPETFSLEEGYPNPVRAGREATVRFGVPSATEVSLTLYDMRGREVAQLVEGRVGAGYHRASVATSDLSSGVYVYRMRAGDEFTGTGTLVVVK